MKLYSLVVDDFFDQPKSIREYLVKQTFKPEISPADNLEYKGVFKSGDLALELEVISKLSGILHSPVVPYISFFRLSLEDLSKRWIHTDILYSKYAFVCYLNDKYPKEAGTRLFYHPKLDLERVTLDEKTIRLWDRMANKPEKWQVAGEVPMRFNRGFIYETRTFHAPLPRNGFGVDNRTGRLVYVMFFNLRS